MSLFCGGGINNILSGSPDIVLISSFQIVLIISEVT